MLPPYAYRVRLTDLRVPGRLKLRDGQPSGDERSERGNRLDLGAADFDCLCVGIGSVTR